jgi:LysR family glycine cleavage system transcriptional activator
MIDRRWLPLNAIRAFEAVGNHLSFTEGARKLNVTQSALSRHVASLEALLKCKLVDRKPHGLVLTAAGTALLPVIRKSFDRLEDMINDILRDGEGPVRTLRVHMPPSFLHHVALPILNDFRREFPTIPVDVSSSSVIGVPTGALDIAVIYDGRCNGDAIRDLLWMVRVSPICTPEIAKASEGLSLSAFLARNELLHVRLEGKPRGCLWSSFADNTGLSVKTDGGLCFDTATLAVQCALSGTGVALADIDMFKDLIESGRLVRPYDVTCEDGYPKTSRNPAWRSSAPG